MDSGIRGRLGIIHDIRRLDVVTVVSSRYSGVKRSRLPAGVVVRHRAYI
jgi:hypothetical protein